MNRAPEGEDVIFQFTINSEPGIRKILKELKEAPPESVGCSSAQDRQIIHGLGVDVLLECRPLGGGQLQFARSGQRGHVRLACRQVPDRHRPQHLDLRPRPVGHQVAEPLIRQRLGVVVAAVPQARQLERPVEPASVRRGPVHGAPRRPGPGGAGGVSDNVDGRLECPPPLASLASDSATRASTVLL